MNNQSTNQKPYYGEELEINLGDYVHIVWRRRKAVSVIFVTIIILVVILSFIWPRTYQSSVLISPAKISDKAVESPVAVIDVLKQESTLRELTKNFGWPEKMANALAKKFTVMPAGDFLQVQATGPTPQKAQELVGIVSDFIINHENTIAAKFRPDLGTEVGFIKSELDENAASIANLEAQIAALSKATSDGQGFIAASYIRARQVALLRRDELQKEFYRKQRELNFDTQIAQLATPAYLPLVPIRPKKLAIMTGGIILGFFIALGYAFIADYVEKMKKQSSV